jgi:hypothetical protein
MRESAQHPRSHQQGVERKKQMRYHLVGNTAFAASLHMHDFLATCLSP